MAYKYSVGDVFFDGKIPATTWTVTAHVANGDYEVQTTLGSFHVGENWLDRQTLISGPSFVQSAASPPAATVTPCCQVPGCVIQPASSVFNLCDEHTAVYPINNPGHPYGTLCPDLACGYFCARGSTCTRKGCSGRIPGLTPMSHTDSFAPKYAVGDKLLWPDGLVAEVLAWRTDRGVRLYTFPGRVREYNWLELANRGAYLVTEAPKTKFPPGVTTIPISFTIPKAVPPKVYPKCEACERELCAYLDDNPRGPPDNLCRDCRGRRQ